VRWSAVVRRVRALFRRSAVEREMREELELHLELQTEALAREGMPPDDARRRARARFGMEPAKEAYRDARGVRPLEDLGRDVVYAVRSLRRRRTFTLVTMVTIALGIGATTSIYTIVDGVLLKPLPYHAPDRLVEVLRTFPDWKKTPILASEWDRILLSIPEYRQLRDRASDLASVAVWQRPRHMMTVGTRTERVSAVATTPEMLDVLGVRPYRGRFFLPSDDVPGAAGVAVVPYEAWQARFGGDPQILGRAIAFDDRPYTIIGILPPGLAVGRTNPDRVTGPPALWIPIGPVSGSDYNERTNHGYQAVARLAAGVSLEAAESQVRSILTDPADSGRVGTRVVSWQKFETRDARSPLLLLLAGAGLLLAIACVNVATLLLGEAASRGQEMAARRALGGGRWRLARQLLTESLVLSAGGGAIGIAAGWAGTRLLVAFAPVGIPGVTGVTMDSRVAAAAVVVVALTGILFGSIPALMLSGTEPAAVLRAGAGQSARGHGALQRCFVASEFAIALVLLAGAGLLVRSFRNLTALDVGFDPHGVVVVNTSLPRSVYTDSALNRRFYDDATAGIAALPGVAAAVEADAPPFDGANSSSFTIEGETGPVASGGYAAAANAIRHQANQNEVGAGYFRLMGIPLIAGRLFTEDDRGGAPPVAVVSAALARRDFPVGSPLGKRLRYQARWWTIVGVVGDVRTGSLRQPVEPMLYTPIAQREIWGPYIVVRAKGALPGPAQMQQALSRVDHRFIATELHPMNDLIASTVSEDRYRALLMTLFAVLAAVLSAVGMYGVTARAASRRQREVGIRLALGASTSEVVRELMRATTVGAGLGVAAGLAAALAVGKLLSPFLFGVRPTDAGTLVTIVLLLGVVAAVAGWLPARRAGRLDVVTVLRAE